MRLPIPSLLHRPPLAADKLWSALAGATFVAVALLGSWMLSGLLWGFSTPAPAPARLDESQPQAVAEALASRPLFAAGMSVPNVAVNSNWHLLGVLAASDTQAARAILRRDGEPATLVLAVGDDAGGGATLRHIGMDGIVLVAAGGESRLSLPRPAVAAATESPADD